MSTDPRESKSPESPGNVPPVSSPEASAEAGAASGEEAVRQAVEAVRGELELARKRINELAYALQASVKDREDFKARLSREREALLDVERAKVAQFLLEAIDEMDLCLTAAPVEDPLAKGVRMIRQGLLSKLSSLGIERIDLLGRPFNPNEAEAADVEISPLPEDDQRVLAEVRAGYKLKGRIIRPARVKVGRYLKPANA